MSEFSDRFKATEGEFAADIKLTRHYANGVAGLRMEMSAGATAMKHYHEYEHMTVIAVGELIVHRSDGRSTRARAGDIINIPAGIEHALQAVTDCVVICIHPTEKYPEVEVLINAPKNSTTPAAPVQKGEH